VFGFHSIGHLWRSGRDHDWMPTHEVGSDSLALSLISRDKPPRNLHAIEPIKCEVLTPSQRLIVIPDEKLSPRRDGAYGLAFHNEPPERGTYRVRWYASTERRRYYEVTRETFVVDE